MGAAALDILSPRDKTHGASTAVCIEMLSQSMGGFAGALRNLRLVGNQMPFNKIGMVNGHVESSSPDAAGLPDARERDRKDTREHAMPPSGFRTLAVLDSPRTSNATTNGSGFQPACSSPRK
jgi:hypothetical protein